MGERRRESREVVQGEGTLSWTDGAGEHSEQIRVEDVSPEGVQVRVGRPLKVGCSVRVAGETCEFQGTVRYCRKDSRGWLAGIQMLGRAYSRQSADYRD